MVGTIFLLLLVALSQESDASNFQTLGGLLFEGVSKSQLVGGLAFSIGALMYYYLFYQSELIPRWLSVWGFIAILLGVAGYLLEFFSTGPVGAFEFAIFHFLIFVQEMVLAVWLIVKGFNSSAMKNMSQSIASPENQR